VIGEEIMKRQLLRLLVVDERAVDVKEHGIRHSTIWEEVLIKIVDVVLVKNVYGHNSIYDTI
jgi:hypothetical protein